MKKVLFIIFSAALVITGCKKDPVNVAPTDSYAVSKYPATLADLNSILGPAYSNLRDPNLFGFNLLPKALANCTHTANSAYGGDAGWNEMTNMNLSITNSYVDGAWRSFYTGVKNCNVFLNAVQVYKQNYMKPADQATVDQMSGQAYFLRAFYYFQLECYFGESYITTAGGGDKMGVPLQDKFITSLDSAQKPRSTVRQTWDFIISDLKQAATLLKGKVWTGNDQGRASEWAAKALLGKAYVFTQDWPNAKTTLLDVIQNSGKTLMPYSKYRDAFIGISANEFNEESLFELNIDQDSKGNYGVYGNTPNATSINGLIWPPWALGNDGTEGNANPLGYGNEIMHDKNVLRFGYKNGTYNLVNNPAFDASKPATYKNPKQVMDPVYKTNSLLVRANKTADPRLYVNGLEPWLDSVKFDGQNWYPVSRPNFYANQSDKYGWSIRKYSPIFNNINNVGPADACNIYFLRMADVYLLYAEAAKGGGDNATALEYVNKVKRRAYDQPINAPSPFDYASLTAATSAAGDPVLGNNPLYYERWAELFNEGHWWFDLCRWRIGKSEATYYGTAINLSGNPINWSDQKSYSWPIPLSEINSNAKMVRQQNPGY
ncbi:MAG: RagB/SusD family nutrient uptake outer membrane protein [Filimonas sp.]|nr:RagB/SusD family nutrient uptake outer membrane protein [Filimonas sp.]